MTRRKPRTRQAGTESRRSDARRKPTRKTSRNAARYELRICKVVGTPKRTHKQSRHPIDLRARIRAARLRMTAGPAADSGPRDRPLEKNSQRWYPEDPSTKTWQQVHLRLMFGPLPAGLTRCATSLSTEESPLFSRRGNVRTRRLESAWLVAAIPSTNLHGGPEARNGLLRQEYNATVRVRTGLLGGPDRPRSPGVDRLTSDREGCRGGGLHSAGKTLRPNKTQKEMGYLDKEKDGTLLASGRS